MECRNARISRSLMGGLTLTLLGATLAGCAFSERGPDPVTFVQQVRQALGEADQRDVPVSQLVGQRWQQLCTHRDGSLTVSLLEVDNKHVLRVPFGQLSVVDGASADSLDGKCLQRDELVHLRRQGQGAQAAIVLERSRVEPDVAATVAIAQP